jgi:hypothetical protein
MALRELIIRLPEEAVEAFLNAPEWERDLAVKRFADSFSPHDRLELAESFLIAQRSLTLEAEASGMTKAELDHIFGT